MESFGNEISESAFKRFDFGTGQTFLFAEKRGTTLSYVQLASL